MPNQTRATTEDDRGTLFRLAMAAVAAGLLFAVFV